MAEVSFTGGSRVGWVNASFPFAKLSCNGQMLRLATLGTYEFTAGQVVSFGTYGSIPLLANGLRIHHNRLDYPEKVVFWCMGSRDEVLRQIAQSGFRPQGQAAERPRGFVFRWGAAAAFVLIWNLLALVGWEHLLYFPHARPSGVGTLLACGFAFAATTAVKGSPRIQRLVLAPGRSVGEVKGFLTLIQLLTGAFASGIALALFFLWRPVG